MPLKKARPIDLIKMDVTYQCGHTLTLNFLNQERAEQVRSDVSTKPLCWTCIEQRRVAREHQLESSGM